MMRRLIGMTLLLSPFMLQAQSNVPVQRKSAETPMLLSSVSQPVGLMLGAAEDRTTGSKSSSVSVRTSTGVVAPKLVKTVRVDGSSIDWRELATKQEAVVSVVVDPTGKPSALKVVRSSSEVTDGHLLDAVSQFRFSPGTVSGEAVSFPVNLVVNIQR